MDKKVASERQLLQRVSEGNDLAFAHLYDLYWDQLFISAYKILKDEEVCKDIVQEVFLGIWKNPTLGEVESIKAYLLKSVRFKVLMKLRKNRVSERHLETMREQTANTTEQFIDFQELNETIESSIEALPDKCQEVFRLSRMEHLSNKEIAEKLNISVRTVETHISHALRSLRSRMDPSVMVLVLLTLLN